jgi:transposase
LPIDSKWKISEVKVDEEKETVEVELAYSLPDVEVLGRRYNIYDHRPIRKWRHLDLWQYKTFISARLPRYKDEQGCYHSIEVTWAESSEQMTVLLEKKF